jgi:serine/threonine protein kinase
LAKNNGPKIEDFELVRLLGKGKNGEVYLAIHQKTGFACGLKIIKKKTLQRGSVE